jgi:hypothetical protein
MQLFDPYSQISLRCIKTFVAAESFVEGTKIGSRVLGSVGWNFAKLFIPAHENDIPESDVRASTLLHFAHDELILISLRNDGNSFDCHLAHVHHLMTLGEDGPCITSGMSNFAYSHSSIDRAMWALHWFVNDSNEWVIGAVDVPHLDVEWRPGSRFFIGHADPIKAKCAAS